MRRLLHLNDAIAAHIPTGRRVVYLDYPMHTNAGDLLIMMGTLAFLKNHRLSARFSGTWKNTPRRGRFPVGPDDVILLHGGGNFGDLYPYHQKFRERVIAEFPDNKIIVLPQSVHFDDTAELDRAAERMARHPDLTIFVRDTWSEGVLRPYFAERVHCVPDMAHQLWPHFAALAGAPPADAARPLFFMRRDKEARPHFAAFAPHAAEFLDWNDIVPRAFSRVTRLFVYLAHAEYLLGRNFRLGPAYCRLATHYVDGVLRSLNARDVWLTSRLHGSIAGLLLGKPVFVVDNAQRKLTNYLATWGDQTAPVGVIDSAGEAEAFADWLGWARRPDAGALWREYEAFCATLTRGRGSSSAPA
jgi:pyruvyl transferase EpsO